MADDPIMQMVSDPQFSQMPLSEQRKALTAHDPTFANVQDGELQKFVQAHTGGASKPDTSFENDSSLGGFLSRIGSAAQGLGSLFTPETKTDKYLDVVPGVLPLKKMIQGQIGAEQQLAPQVKQQFQTGQYARGSVSALSMLDPFATSSVANINQLQDRGQSNQATGAGAADIAMMLPGLKGSFTPGQLSATDVAANLRQALKAKNPSFSGEVQTALPAIQEQLAAGKTASSLPGFIDTVRSAKQAIWQKYSQRLAATNQSGATIDGNSIAQSQLNALPDAITDQVDPGISNQIGKTFDVYAGKKFTPEQIEARIQAINNELGSKYAQMGKGVDYSAVARDPYIAPRLAEADALRQSLYDTIDKTSPSPDAAAALKRQYGALTSIEQATLKRQIGVSAQAPFSLSDQLNLPAAAHDLFFGGPASAIARLASRAIIKNRNNPDALVNKAFTPDSSPLSKAALTGTAAGAETTAQPTIPPNMKQALMDLLSKQGSQQ